MTVAVVFRLPTSITDPSFLRQVTHLRQLLVVERALQFSPAVLAGRSNGAWMPWPNFVAILFSAGELALGTAILRFLGGSELSIDPTRGGGA